VCEPLSLDQGDGDLYIEGLYFQSAAWDDETGSIIESDKYMNKVCGTNRPSPRSSLAYFV